MHQTFSRRAFTLIELLVVIAIISLLATLVMTNFEKSRRAARDAGRVSDIHSMRTALDQFYDTNEFYIPSDPSYNTACGRIVGAAPIQGWCSSVGTKYQDHWLWANPSGSLYYTLGAYFPKDPEPKPFVVTNPSYPMSSGRFFYYSGNGTSAYGGPPPAANTYDTAQFVDRPRWYMLVYALENATDGTNYSVTTPSGNSTFNYAELYSDPHIYTVGRSTR